MPVPATYPQWATDNINNTEPALAKKEDGWAIGEDGNSSWMNWWQNLVYLWIVYLRTERDDLATRLTTAEAGIVTLDAKLEAYGARVRTLPITPGTNGGSFLTFQNTLGADGQTFVSTNAAWVWWSQDHGAWPLREGEKITGVTVRFKIPSAGNFATARLYRWSTNGTASEVENWTVSGGAGGWGSHTHTIVSASNVPAAGQRYFIKLEGVASGDYLGSVAVSVDPYP